MPNQTHVSVLSVLGEDARALAGIPSLAAAFARIDSALRPHLQSGATGLVEVCPSDIIRDDPTHGQMAVNLLPGSFCQQCCRATDGTVHAGEAFAALYAKAARAKVSGKPESELDADTRALLSAEVFYRFDVDMLRAAAAAQAKPTEALPVRRQVTP